MRHFVHALFRDVIVFTAKLDFLSIRMAILASSCPVHAVIQSRSRGAVSTRFFRSMVRYAESTWLALENNPTHRSTIPLIDQAQNCSVFYPFPTSAIMICSRNGTSANHQRLAIRARLHQVVERLRACHRSRGANCGIGTLHNAFPFAHR